MSSNTNRMVPEMSSALENTKSKMREKQLLPDRYPNGHLFMCDLGDVALKDDTASMEHPIFALATKPDLNIKEYEHNGNTVRITPSVKGLATIHDKDILIFAISQIMEAKNRGQPYSREISFDASDFLRFANRMTNGRGYEGLKDALTRLRGTTIETNIETGNEEQTEGFGLIESFRIRKTLNDGRIVNWGVTLSEWLFNAIEEDEVLTIQKEYFRLRKPLERRIYEIARKHCGQQAKWTISLELLIKKSGSQTSKKKFKQMLQTIVEYDHLPDYRIGIIEDRKEGDKVCFTNRNTNKGQSTLPLFPMQLNPETLQKARKVAPNWDVYYLEQQWRDWMNETGKHPEKSFDGAFLGFCKTWYKTHGEPK